MNYEFEIRFTSERIRDIEMRIVEINQELHQLLGDAPIGRQTNGHAWEGAQSGNVVQRMMGSTQCAISHTT